MACACTSPPVWLGTTELSYPINLTPGSGQHPSCWLLQAGWRAAGQPISLSCAVQARHAKSVSIQQQTCKSQTVSQSGWIELPSKACFAADLSFAEIHVDARAGDVMAGAGGAAGPTYVTNLQVNQLYYTVSIDSLTTMLAAQWIRQHSGMQMVLIRTQS